MKKRIIEIAVKVIVAALTAFLTAITLSHGDRYLSHTQAPVPVTGGDCPHD